MFQNLTPPPEDKILQLMQVYRDDEREGKIDLGVGVYRDAQGGTPVMAAVKSAEKLIWEQQQTKSYTSLAGEQQFNDAMVELILGDAIEREQVASVATPGGTGAIRQAFELIRLANPSVRVHASDPTWPNHTSILKYLNIEAVSYRYFDADSKGIDANGMLEDIATATANDVILLHGCCHNPTGANPNTAEWDAIIESLLNTGATPLIDLAYQGFGDGLEEDVASVRKIVDACPEVIIAASCSKNFGLYRERTGQLLVTTQTDDQRSVDVKQKTLAFLNRQNYSFPPDHGARVVSTVLSNEELRQEWQRELEAMRLSMLEIRQQLTRELQQLTGSDRFAFIGQHRGMFSQLGCSPSLIAAMREDHAIYMISDSRINIAGLNTKTVPILAQAMVDVGM
ncbi:MAG: aspartate/tyrosine/aromatic aminotransferase [Aestuariivita sp.]|nr:aspartate/tyrosine/aromatic aminotransferase [Aestuariivita sp.]MCY4202988.1 aspartate/tyrosine/aromatic aminotransferase [Aestuariivita sp.]MCY4289032.1 aspartate/tyrosine/aromatic aminotransferase [Aestuariivita sp.]MCY4347460.1 aspartate/tyrosine/aromatic aminotransferase [Aestuariivita sp.]